MPTHFLKIIFLFGFVLFSCKKEGNLQKNISNVFTDSVLNNEKINSKKKVTLAENIERNSFSLPKNFYVHDSCFVKNKSTNFKILAIEKLENKNNKGNWYFGLPIIILKTNSKNENKEIYRNDNLVFRFYDNCPADGYGGLVAKNNYFTIEQISCIDFLFVRSFITFKINNDDSIFLHKYGEEYTDRSNPDREIPSQIWTVKDFGKLNFEEVTEDKLYNIRLNKPKNNNQ